MKKMISILFLYMGLFFPLIADTTYSVDFSQPEIKESDNIDKVNTGPGTEYNAVNGNSWVLNCSGKSYIEIIFTKPPEIYGLCTLNISHLHSLNDGFGYSPINVYVNNKLFLDHFNPIYGGAYTNDTFSLGTEIKDGVNKIKILFCKEGITDYWINKLSIEITNPI